MFCQELGEINADSTFHIILGNFNINFIEQNSQISHLLLDYVQIVSEPTQTSGSLLDHVYIERNILDTMDVKTYVNTIYFSDHNAIQFTLSKKYALV